MASFAMVTRKGNILFAIKHFMFPLQCNRVLKKLHDLSDVAINFDHIFQMLARGLKGLLV